MIPLRCRDVLLDASRSQRLRRSGLSRRTVTVLISLSTIAIRETLSNSSLPIVDLTGIDRAAEDRVRSGRFLRNQGAHLSAMAQVLYLLRAHAEQNQLLAR